MRFNSKLLLLRMLLIILRNFSSHSRMSPLTCIIPSYILLKNVEYSRLGDHRQRCKLHLRPIDQAFRGKKWTSRGIFICDPAFIARTRLLSSAGIFCSTILLALLNFNQGTCRCCAELGTIGIPIGRDCVRRSIHSGHNLISILTSITLQGDDLGGVLMQSYHDGIKPASGMRISRTHALRLLFPEGSAIDSRLE